MKNIFLYYIIILAPIGFFIWMLNAELMNSLKEVGLFLFYCLIYRTYTDGKRLADKNIIHNKDIWKMIIPGKRILHFKELYMK